MSSEGGADRLFKVGPDRGLKQMPGEIKLADNKAPINLFLEDKPVVSNDERREAVQNLRAIAERRPDEFAKLSEMSFIDAKAEAHRLLADVEAEDERGSSQENAA